MKSIIGFIKSYTSETDKWLLVLCTIFIAALIFLNYGFHLENDLVRSSLPFPSISGRLIIFLPALVIPYLLAAARKRLKLNGALLVCLLLAPVFFAIKAGMDTQLHFSNDVDWNGYWNGVASWPLRMLFVVVALAICHYIFHREQNLYGLSAKKFDARPYLIMLLIMLPLIAIASTQADFLQSYPKLNRVLPLPDGANPGWVYKLLFELAYGTDFFSIELFFRGFLVIGLMKWAGKEAILPMACFYCTIHFGKPLGECISSYFGGLLLGIVSYHTRSIYGGLMVHLGIAWMMELGGFIGSALLHVQ